MSRPSLRALFSTFSLLVFAVSLRAQAPEPIQAPPPAIKSNQQTAMANSVAPAGQLLTLEECIARAMQKNFDLQIQSFSTANAKEQLNIAKAGFEPILTLSTERSVTQQSATTSTITGTTGAVGPRVDSTDTRAGVTQNISATNATAQLSTSLTRDANNYSNSLINPVYRSDVVLAVTQPLLHGAGRTFARSAIERSKLGVGIANLTFKGSVLSVVRNTETAYYNLGYTRANLLVRQHSLELAQKLYDENKARKASGVATDLDVATAEVGVETARNNVLLAEQAVRNSEDTLLNLIGQFEFDHRPGPVQFSDFSESLPTFDLSYKLARDNFPDYLAQQETIKQYTIDVATAKRSKLPTLNLDGALGYNGQNRSYGSAINDVPEGKGYSWNLGLSLSVPWGLHADRARYRIANNNLHQQESFLQQLDQDLVVNVRTAVRSVQVNVQSVAISAKSTELSEKQYQLQKARFDAGLATSRQVLEAQDTLESARVSELQAKVALHNAVSELRRLETSSLGRYRIVLP